MTTTRRIDWVVFAILLLSLGINVWLFTSLRAVARLGPRRAMVGTAGAPLKEGDKAPLLTVIDLGGQGATLDFGHRPRPTVVYVISTSCRWCERNVANVRALIARRGKEYDFMALSLRDQGLDDVRRFVASTALDVPVYRSLSEASIRAWGLAGTPQTIVVGKDGTVLRTWGGAYVGPIARAVGDYFDVKLPDTGAAEAPETKTAEQPSPGRQASLGSAATCRDKEGLEYSPGAKVVIDGVQQVCSPGGRWENP